MKLDEPARVPKSEWSQHFLQYMINRMAMSFSTYGLVREAYPDKVDALKSLRIRLQKYEQTGNKEYLVDVANFAMIEFMHPGHTNAHFEAVDSNVSPGRKWHDKYEPTRKRNND